MAIVCIGQSEFIRPSCAPYRLPCHPSPRHPQYFPSIFKTVGVLKPVFLLYTTVFQRDQSILGNTQRHLALYLFWLKARSTLLHNKALHLIVVYIPCPYNGDISKRCIAYPLFLAVQHPFVAFSFGGYCQASRYRRTHFWLRQAKCANNFHLLHQRQPLLFLFFRSTQIDRPHGQPTMHPKESGDGNVYSSHFHGQKTFQQKSTVGTPIPIISQPCYVQFCHFRDQLKRKLIPKPIFIRNWLYLPLHKITDFELDLPLLWSEQRRQVIEIPVYWRKRLLLVTTFQKL